MRAHAMDGFRARARLARSFIITDLDDRLPRGAMMDTRTAWSLINDLLGLEKDAS